MPTHIKLSWQSTDLLSNISEKAKVNENGTFDNLGFFCFQNMILQSGSTYIKYLRKVRSLLHNYRKHRRTDNSQNHNLLVEVKMNFLQFSGKLERFHEWQFSYRATLMNFSFLTLRTKNECKRTGDILG